MEFKHRSFLWKTKGNPVFLEGDPARDVGVVLMGAVQVVREDYYGNRSIMTILQPGALFAEAEIQFILCYNTNKGKALI